VATLGFRGEALPSIAAVSRFELRSRSPQDEAGTRVRVEGGTLKSVTEVGCAVGTEVEVGSLFFNLPARKAFLRARTTELNHCIAVVMRECLTRQAVDFRLVHEGRELILAPVAASIRERAKAVLGDVGGALLDVDATRGPVRVVGLASPIGVHRSSAAAAVYLYVNGRYVRDGLLRRAVYEAYRGRVPRGRYPVVVLDLRLPAQQVDVNVHPTKVEVRFHRPYEVSDAVADILREVIDEAGIGPIHRDPTLGAVTPGPLFRAPEPLPLAADPGGPGSSSLPQPAPNYGGLGPTAHPDDDARVARAAPSLAVESRPSLSTMARPSVRLVGKFRELTVLGGHGAGWIVCSAGADLMMVNVRAARACMWSAALVQGDVGALGPSQRLLAPVRVTLTVLQADVLEAGADTLARYNLDVDRFGPQEVAVRGVPPTLAAADPQRLMRKLVDALGRGEEAVAVVLAHEAASTTAPPIDDRARKTLLATLDEHGIQVGPPVVARLTAEELSRRARDGSS
jgi:DNA mismatch repair protein MutL